MPCPRQQEPGPDQYIILQTRASNTYRSALSDLGDVSLGLGGFGGCGGLLSGSGLGCGLGSSLLGCSGLLSRCLLCSSSLVEISIMSLVHMASSTHGLLGLSSCLRCGLGGLGLSLLGSRRGASLCLCDFHGSRSTYCQSESCPTNIHLSRGSRKDGKEIEAYPWDARRHRSHYPWREHG